MCGPLPGRIWLKRSTSRNPKSDSPALRKTLVAVALLGAAAVGLYASGFAEGFVEGFISSVHGHPGLPSCESSHGQSDAKRAIENSPLAKTTGLSVIALTDPKTLSIAAQKVECSATIVLNSARKGVLTYSFVADASMGSGKYLIRASVDPDSLVSYP
jgi:hypothetical protein